MTRPRVRKRASENCVRQRARSTTRKRGPKPGTPSWRRFNYTPDLIADCRRRYEDTPETNASIARGYGVDDCTVRRMAKRFGWTKYRAPPVDLPPALRLRKQVEALASLPPPASPLPPPERGRVGVGVNTGAQGTPTRTASQSDLALSGRGEEKTLSGGGNGEAAPLSGGGEQAPPLAATIDEVHRTVLAELSTVRRLRARMKDEPQKPADAQRTAQTLATLTATLRDLQRMQAAAPVPTSGTNDYDDTYDDTPADIDDFRRDLARRIDAFVASRTEPRDADGGGGDSTV